MEYVAALVMLFLVLLLCSMVPLALWKQDADRKRAQEKPQEQVQEPHGDDNMQLPERTVSVGTCPGGVSVDMDCPNGDSASTSIAIEEDVIQNRSADLYTLAKGYLDVLMELEKPSRGNGLQSLFLQVIRKYLPPDVNGHLLSRIQGMPTQWEWDVLLCRGEPLQGPWKRPRFDPVNVVGLFEIKCNGITPRSGTKLRREDAIREALHFKRTQFLQARQCCPNLGILGYFSLQEHTRQGVATIAYYELTKQILEPEVMTVIPFQRQFEAGRPVPPMYPNAHAEWEGLVERLNKL